MQWQTSQMRNQRLMESTANFGTGSYVFAYGGIVRPKDYKVPAEYEAIDLSEVEN